MSHSYHQNLVHIVFSTKERRPTIDLEIESRLHAYLGGIIRQQNGVALRINGTSDHVHILAKTQRAVADSDFMRVLKTNSSRWVHETFSRHANFRWQTGYGWFSVSFSQVSKVESYIDGQKQHHAQMTFQDEFIQLLQKHGIEYDEQFLWD